MNYLVLNSLYCLKKKLYSYFYLFWEKAKKKSGCCVVFVKKRTKFCCVVFLLTSCLFFFILFLTLKKSNPSNVKLSVSLTFSCLLFFSCCYHYLTKVINNSSLKFSPCFFSSLMLFLLLVLQFRSTFVQFSKKNAYKIKSYEYVLWQNKNFRHLKSTTKTLFYLFFLFVVKRFNLERERERDIAIIFSFKIFI